MYLQIIIYMISALGPLNAGNDKTKALQLACKQVRYGFTKNSTYISYEV